MSTRAFPNYGSYWSDACSKGGNGQCDGLIPDDEDGGLSECACPCHSGWDDYGTTVAEIEKSHVNYWKEG